MQYHPVIPTIVDHEEEYDDSILPPELIKERSNSSYDFLLSFAY
jgi:hypothetical protein